MTSNASRAVKLCGTEQPDVVGKILTAGPLTAEFDNGNLRYVRLNGVEVLRAISYLARDENWGTYTPELSELEIDPRGDGFTVSYHALCERPGQALEYDARIEGRADGSLEFHAVARARSDFLTNRTGFVVLHPLKGVVGRKLKVLKVDGSEVMSSFPESVDPDCPFRDIRALSHEALPGVWVTCRMEGETFEMEDHRNWTDASFKTYVRPLAKPWPYTIPEDEVFEQSIKLTLSGALPRGAGGGAGERIALRVGGSSARTMPPVGIGVPADEVDHALAQTELVRMLAPKFLVCHFDARAGHGLSQLTKYAQLCAVTQAQAALEVVVQSVQDYAAELRGVADLVRISGLMVKSVAVCPVGHLKSVLPGGTYPPAPALEDLYAAARNAFPGVELGGGMFSFFTELNRKRPPAQLLDFVTNTTCPIVHAPDDRSVMETLEALPWQIKTARGFIAKASHRVGPSGIGCRDNPHGATYTPNPDNLRVCLAKMDPRQRGLFGAAWTLGYVASLARAGVDHVSLGAATGPLGAVYRKTDYAQPYFDDLGKPSVYPLFHVLSGLTRATGEKLLTLESDDESKITGLAYRSKQGTTLWLANLTASTQSVALEGIGSGATVGMLDERSFARATSDPAGFRKSGKRVSNLTSLSLGAYAVAFIAGD